MTGKHEAGAHEAGAHQTATPEDGTPGTGVLEFDARFIQQPHVNYEWLRQEGPARQAILPRGTRAWLVTRYEDVRALLADPRLSKDSARANELFARHTAAGGRPMLEASQGLVAHMLNTDPPDHTRLRKLVNKAFTARTVQRLRPRVEEITTRLLDDLAGVEETDLLDSLAFPVPIQVICELLGVPETDRASFRQWSNTLLSVSDMDEIAEASAKMAGYLAGLIADKREHPGADLLGELVHARDADDRLNDSELTGMAFLLLVAGHETTVNLIGNGVLALLRNPEQLAALRADPALLPGAIEEFLRFDGPLNLATFRHTTQPVRVGEVEIGAGEFVMLSLLSANRDPERFADPDSLDVRRQPAGHVAFGHGIHYCVGAPLARLEGEIAIGELLRRYPRLRLAGQPETLRWRESSLIHGLRTLPVRLGG